VKEQLIVWTLLKPAFSIYRVIAGAEQSAGSLANARAQMSGSQVIEVVFEGIPGTIIQLMALFQDGADTSAWRLASLGSSAFTTAFISADMSFGWDASPEQRRRDPRFYGYLPTQLARRALSMLLVFIVSICNLAARSLACVLLVKKGGVPLLSAVLGGELGLFLALKTARGDFWYWTPVYGIPGFVFSLLVRLIVKISVDWTAIMQFRHPNEVGGAYFTLTMLSTVALGIISAFFHGDEVVTRSMMAISGGLVFSFVLFLFSIEQEYVHTFFDLRTSCKFNTDHFKNAVTDEERIDVFVTNEYKWRDAIGDEVKDWVDQNLESWVEESPDWFNDYRKSTIPDWAVRDERLLWGIRNDKINSIMSARHRSYREPSSYREPRRASELGLGLIE